MSKQVSAPTTLQQAQAKALLSLLNLNQPSETAASPGKQSSGLKSPSVAGPPVWKVLVLDQQTRDVLAVVLQVQDLRDAGITLHVQLHSLRPALPDVPAIYFVSPTLQNIKRITEDLRKGLYESFHLNFVDPLPRSLLEELAASVAQDGTGDLIQQVVDQYLSFITPSASLFSLLPPPTPPPSIQSPTPPEPNQVVSTYTIFNSPQTSEQQIEEEVERVANGLFAAIATSAHVPFIRAPRGNAAEMIAKRLETKIRDAVLSASRPTNPSASLFSQDSSGLSSLQRPLLLILDRNLDLVTPLVHGWTYQSLVSECLEFKLNRATIPPQEGQPTKRYIDLDSKDFFWTRHASTIFPEVTADVDEELTKYKQEADELARKSGNNDPTQVDPNADAAHIKHAMNQLPELMARKAALDSHMNLLSSLMTQIRERGLDELAATEENISKYTVSSLLDLLRKPREGGGTFTPSDKLRLVIVFYLSSADNVLSRDDIAELEKELKECGADVAAFNYVRKTREILRVTSSVGVANAGGAATPNLGSVAGQGGEFLKKGFGALSNRLAGSLKEGTFDTLLSSVKNFIPTNKLFPVTRLTEALMDSSAASNQSLQETDDYLFLDPRAPKHVQLPGGAGGSGVGRARRMAFNDGIVFVVGGAGYVEYGNLEEWASKTGKRITYGGTEINDPNGFLKLLESLGKSST
ncbi:Sec1-like protein [Coprinopsis marcescibilis]|uniref:Sec1-like protein n=1 Tax=Coprinopsis marcescibilis TaxID=230819 RepID=A0A5C3L1U9_COPMA|nr:Sec1-like protein [Coprinopsis marcescibilis]